MDGLEVEGLMVMPAPADDPEATRPAFRRTAELAAQAGLARLSMGMTADFEVAVEEGATLVRVGTALFGPRPTRRAGAPPREVAPEPVTASPTIRSGAPITTSENGQTDVPGAYAVTSEATIAIVFPAPPKADVLRCLDSCRHGER